MKVFMSWSGDRSRETAALFYGWISCVLQAVEPWMSTDDIDRGTVWFNEIGNQLAETRIGIIFLTQINKAAPWILFEAGALAKGLSSTTKVCTFLVDLPTGDVGAPLSHFNATVATKTGVFGLVNTLNKSLDAPLTEINLAKVFEIWWPEFETKFAELLERIPSNAVVKHRTDREMIEEILENTRNIERRIPLTNLNFPTWPKLAFNHWLSSNEYPTSKSTKKHQLLAAHLLLRDKVKHGMHLDDFLAEAASTNFSDEVARQVWSDLINIEPRPDITGTLDSSEGA